MNAKLVVAETNQSPATPPVTNPMDAEVDMELLRSVPQKFSIQTGDHANWLVRRICAARQYSLQVKSWCEREQRRAAREEMTLLFLFGRQLEDFAKTEIEKFGGRKSLPLPAAVLAFRTVGPTLQIDDEDAVLKWAATNCPSAITRVTTTKLIKSVLNDMFKNSGVIPDAGVHVEPERQVFSIR